MSKITKNTIKYGLSIVAILVVGLLTLTPNSTEAKERTGYYNGYSEDYVNTSYNPTYAVTNTYNPNPSSTNSYVLGASTSATIPKTVAKAEPTDYKEIKEEFSDLTASAVYGEDSFFPTSIVGWLLFAIFTLIIVVLVRKFAGLEKKYNDLPAKYS